jgi:hypothetical protein
MAGSDSGFGVKAESDYVAVDAAAAALAALHAAGFRQAQKFHGSFIGKLPNALDDFRSYSVVTHDHSRVPGNKIESELTEVLLSWVAWVDQRRKGRVVM